ncbi:MAG: YbaK/EbsC family protein [Pseudomonadota bacterium]|nr:YbaK/EbsC family protein [Pseudomonadota bacterium]
MSDTEPFIRQLLEASGQPFEVMACDPALADTADFCAHYGVAPDHSANAILVKSKTGPEKFACCVVLATCRLDVNKVVRKRLGARKVSFAGAEETRAITGMEIGGVTPIGLPSGLPVWVDGRIAGLEYIILGGGNRASKLKIPPALLLALPGVNLVDDLAQPVPVAAD